MTGSDGTLLEPSQLVPYLLNAGILEAADVVTGAVEIETIERKNISYRVTAGPRAFILKRSRLADDPSVHHEAAAYAYLTAAVREIHDVVPEVLGFDAESCLLTLEYYSDAPNLRELYQRGRQVPLQLGRLLAHSLAMLHESGLPGPASPLVATNPPWVLSLLEPTVEVYFYESRGVIDLIRRIQGAPLLAGMVAEFAESWSTDSVCHGDLRLDNLVYVPRPPAGKQRLAIVDWELCGAGWSAWDLACLLASFVELWVTGSGPRLPQHAAKEQLGRPGMSKHHGLLRAIWAEYHKGRLSQPSAAVSADRLCRLVGLRLLQSALEYSQQSPGPTRESIMLLALAQRLAERPLESWVHILGLPVAEASGSISA